MNLEAAKAVKYGGVAEMEALKFVTINPAMQMKTDAAWGLSSRERTPTSSSGAASALHIYVLRADLGGRAQAVRPRR